MTLVLLFRAGAVNLQQLDGISIGLSATGATVIPKATLFPGSTLIPRQAFLTVSSPVPPFLVMPPRVVYTFH